MMLYQSMPLLLIFLVMRLSLLLLSSYIFWCALLQPELKVLHGRIPVGLAVFRKGE